MIHKQNSVPASSIKPPEKERLVLSIKCGLFKTTSPLIEIEKNLQQTAESIIKKFMQNNVPSLTYSESFGLQAECRRQLTDCLNQTLKSIKEHARPVLGKQIFTKMCTDTANYLVSLGEVDADKFNEAYNSVNEPKDLPKVPLNKSWGKSP